MKNNSFLSAHAPLLTGSLKCPYTYLEQPEGSISPCTFKNMEETMSSQTYGKLFKPKIQTRLMKIMPTVVNESDFKLEAVRELAQLTNNSARRQPLKSVKNTIISTLSSRLSRIQYQESQPQKTIHSSSSSYFIQGCFSLSQHHRVKAGH